MCKVASVTCHFTPLQKLPSHSIREGSMATQMSPSQSFLLISIFLFIFSSSLAIEANDEPKTVAAVVKSKWPSFPFYFVGSEIIANQNNDEYWKFVDHLLEKPTGDTQEAQFNDMMNYEQQKSQTAAAQFSISFALSSSLPKLEMYRSISNDVLKSFSNQQPSTASNETQNILSDWFSILPDEAGNLQLVQSFETLQKLVNHQISSQKAEQQEKFWNRVYSFDHQRGSNGQSNIVVYGDIGRQSFKTVHEYMSTTANSQKLNYVLRPWTRFLGPPSHLQGYGVELAMKNVEYRVLDESLKKSLDSEDESKHHKSIPKEFDIHAAYAKTLKEQFPEIAEQVDDVMERLFMSEEELKEAGKSNPIVVKSESDVLHDLGIKTLQSILKSNDPLKTMRDISQNLPTMSPLVLLQPLEDETKQFHDSSSSGIQFGGNSIHINSKMLDVSTLDPYELLEIFSSELIKFDFLEKISPNSSNIFDLLALEPSKQVSPIIDLNWQDITLFVNDLEKDSAYSRWPKSIKTLLMRPGQIFPIAKNLYTLILVIDPLVQNSIGIQILDNIVRTVLGNQIPIRIGFLIVTANPSTTDSLFHEEHQVEYCSRLDELKCDLGFMYAKLMKSLIQNSNAFSQFLLHAASNPSNHKTVFDAFNAATMDISYEEALGGNSDWLKKQFTYLRSAGFYRPSLPLLDQKLSSKEQNEIIHQFVASSLSSSGRNAAFLNGKFVSLNAERPISSIVSEVYAQKNTISYDVYFGHIDDTTNVYDYIIHKSESDQYPAFSSSIFTDEENPPFFVNLEEFENHDLYNQMQWFESSTAQQNQDFETDENSDNNDESSTKSEDHHDQKEKLKIVSHILASDFSSVGSIGIAKSLLNLMLENDPIQSISRITFVPFNQIYDMDSDYSNRHELSQSLSWTIVNLLNHIASSHSGPESNQIELKLAIDVLRRLENNLDDVLSLFSTEMKKHGLQKKKLSTLLCSDEIDINEVSSSTHYSSTSIDSQCQLALKSSLSEDPNQSNQLFQKNVLQFSRFLQNQLPSNPKLSDKISHADNIHPISPTHMKAFGTGGAILVSNGRFLHLLESEARAWTDIHWNIITKYEEQSRAKHVHELIEKSGEESGSINSASSRSTIIMRVISLINSLMSGNSDDDSAIYAGMRMQQSMENQESQNTKLIVKSKCLLQNEIIETPNGDNNGKDYVCLDAQGNPVKEAKIVVNLKIDPLSNSAQTVSALLMPFMEILPIELRIVMLPRMMITELPLKNYFRYVFDGNLKFHSSSNPSKSIDNQSNQGVDSKELSHGQLIQPVALFDHLPQSKVLTLNLKTPSEWLVEPVEFEQDLDNLLLKSIHLGNGENQVKAVFELENILIEGSCSDQSKHGEPPRGLQLILGNENDNHMVDTLVMSNLGYFQLKANPGVWQLNLAEGRHRDLYQIVSSQSSEKSKSSGMIMRTSSSQLASHSGQSSSINLFNFKGSQINLQVKKRPGMEDNNLFNIEESGYGNMETAGFWNSMFGSNDEASSNESDDETVHIFSVASGHLYERFMRIMMLSVRKTTNKPVKFWIIKNFLSPSFKKSLKSMGEEFGFEVELVQYQWPQWLHGQTEKQRKIWGFKILFLDVLFPLSLKKVIFIDADQVVRSDLSELMKLDLNGAVYGFTPFCNGEIKRMETKGFRFWDSGFWNNHLHGLPYHISALFVVDLQKFRMMGSGDTLRATYEQLSRDPESLANLDQDLPNYLQHHVRIFSLPKEWLWCETWCTDESKEQAKTIDLCNNPLTKTPKLENALRIIPEWKDLDDEQSKFYSKFLQHNQENSTQLKSSQVSQSELIKDQNRKDEL